MKSPYDLSTIETLPRMNEEQVFQAMDRAQALFLDRSKWIPTHERIAILERVAESFQERREELALQAAREGGKPLKDSLVEVDRGINGVRIAIQELSNLTGREVAMGVTASSAGRKAYTTFVPRGVVVAISAFNHPFNLIVHQAIPAVAVGCPVLVKPASSTPLSCKAVVDTLHDCGLPNDWAQMILCESRVASKLAADPRNTFLTFIGSGAVGWKLRSQLPPGATCALEHGGSAPVIIDETADIDAAVAPLTRGAFYHAGQVCVSVQRIFVHEKAEAEFMEKLQAAVAQLVVGDPADAATDVGPLIEPGEVDRVDEWVRNSGGEVLTGGRKLSETTYAPTIIKNPAPDSDVARHEVFGPVVTIQTFTDIDDAIARANDCDFAFQASIYTNRLDHMTKAVEELNGTAIMVNDHTAFRVDWMPFGGYKDSGLGMGGIPHTMRDMCVERMFVVKKG